MCPEKALCQGLTEGEWVLVRGGREGGGHCHGDFPGARTGCGLEYGHFVLAGAVDARKWSKC